MYPDFDPKRLLAVINTTKDQTLIYATGGGPSSPTKGTFGGSVGSYQLYLAFDCASAGMTDTDILELIYDESVGMEEAKASIDIISGKSGLDVNLLNSSFGGKVGNVMPAPFQDNALSIGVLNGGVLESPAMNVNNELIIDATQSGDVPVTGTVSITGFVDVNNFPSPQDVSVINFPATQAVTGTFWPATQAISASSLPLPSGASTSALQTTGNTSLSNIDGKLNSLGQKASSASMPVVIASDQTVNTLSTDVSITGQSAQTTIVNNILTTTSGASATDAFNYKSATVQIVSTGIGGTYIFECSNDNVNFQTMPVYNQLTVTGTAIISSIAATASQLIYTFPIQARYIRLRIVSTITGGSIQAFTKLSQAPFSHAFYTVAQSNSTNLQATVTGTLTGVTTVSAVTSSATASATVTDITSAAITSTQTSGNITTLNTQAASWLVNVTAISGSGAAMDVVIQETMDATNYYTVYSFERITATGQYYSPCIKLSGSGYRIVRTVSGTTPSITNSVVRISRSGQAETARRFINRTIDPNTLNSNTGSFFCDGVEDFNIMVRCTAQTTPATISLEFSNDNVNWFTSTVTVSTVNGIAREKVQNEQWKFVRATVTAAGSGITLDNVVIGGHSA